MNRTIPFGKPILGEEEKAAVMAVMDSGIMVHGPKIKEFEQAFAGFTGAPYAVGVSSCTAGLHLTYFALGIGPGDEVLVPAMTHTATVHAVELVGARPVFVDAEAQTGNIDLEQAESLITVKTRAISVVHYLGMPVDMRRVQQIAAKHKLHIIEDCALSLGGRLGGRHTGLFGVSGCFSFYPVKHLTTAEGGMLITTDPRLAEQIELVRAFGVDRHHGVRKVPGFYDVVALGFNYRMSEIHAAIGIEQMKRLPGFLAQRKKNYEALTAALRKVPSVDLLQSSRGEFQSSYYCHLFRLPDSLKADRPAIMDRLKALGVGTSIYYPQPVARMTYYRRKYGYTEGQYPNAERIADAGIALPVGPHLKEEDMAYIGEQVQKVLADY